MNSKESEQAALRLLSGLGLNVQRLAETGDTKMPDFFASDDRGTRYLFEVKEKLPDEREERRRDRALESGDAYTKSTPVIRSNRVSGVVGSAVEQLSSPAAPAADLRLMIFVASGRDPDVQADQLFDTLYGAWTLMDLDTKVSRPCLYYTFSDFFRYAHVLDGAILIQSGSVSLFFNDRSPRAHILRESEVADAMREAIFDPVEAERSQRVYVADTELDRRNRGPVLLYVQEKYDRRLRLTELARVAWTAEVAVRREGGHGAT